MLTYSARCLSVPRRPYNSHSVQSDVPIARRDFARETACRMSSERNATPPPPPTTTMTATTCSSFFESRCPHGRTNERTHGIGRHRSAAGALPRRRISRVTTSDAAAQGARNPPCPMNDEITDSSWRDYLYLSKH